MRATPSPMDSAKRRRRSRNGAASNDVLMTSPPAPGQVPLNGFFLGLPLYTYQGIAVGRYPRHAHTCPSRKPTPIKTLDFPSFVLPLGQYTFTLCHALWEALVMPPVSPKIPTEWEGPSPGSSSRCCRRTRALEREGALMCQHFSGQKVPLAFNACS
jgi:hypothetical protein